MKHIKLLLLEVVCVQGDPVFILLSIKLMRVEDFIVQHRYNFCCNCFNQYCLFYVKIVLSKKFWIVTKVLDLQYQIKIVDNLHWKSSCFELLCS